MSLPYIPIEITRMIFSYIPIETRGICREAYTWAEVAISQQLHLHRPWCFCDKHTASLEFDAMAATMTAQHRLAAFYHGYHRYKLEYSYVELHRDYSMIAVRNPESLTSKPDWYYVRCADEFAVYIHNRYLGVYIRKSNLYLQIGYDGCVTEPDSQGHDSDLGTLDPKCMDTDCSAIMSTNVRGININDIAANSGIDGNRIHESIAQLISWITNPIYRAIRLFSYTDI